MIEQRLLSLTLRGAGWVLWLLVGLSVLSVAVMFERALYFAQRRMSKLFPELLRLCQDGALDKQCNANLELSVPECRRRADGTDDHDRARNIQRRPQ